MKRWMSWLLVLVMMLGTFGTLTACGTKTTVIDYADAESFEAALNAGENLEGKVVRFVAGEFHPDSALGYNVWAGEHLNFVSSRNPDIKEGDIVTVRALTIESAMGSWIINYEKVDNAEITEATITSNAEDAFDGVNGQIDDQGAKAENFSIKEPFEHNNESGGVASFSVDDEDVVSEALPLELTDYGWYINETSSYDDTVYVDFCGMIHNPNEALIAEFPEVTVTVKNDDGSIMATEEQMGGIVMPGDTITLCGMFSMPAGDLSDDAQILFDVEWSDFTTSSSMYKNVRSSDFEFSNVSEHKGSGENLITGEVTNNSSIDVDSANISMILRKEGEIVFMENTFIDGLKSGKTKAFEFQRYHNWPEHDTIECSAQPW